MDREPAEGAEAPDAERAEAPDAERAASLIEAAKRCKKRGKGAETHLRGDDKGLCEPELWPRSAQS